METNGNVSSNIVRKDTNFGDVCRQRLFCVGSQQIQYVEGRFSLILWDKKINNAIQHLVSEHFEFLIDVIDKLIWKGKEWVALRIFGFFQIGMKWIFCLDTEKFFTALVQLFMLLGNVGREMLLKLSHHLLLTYIDTQKESMTAFRGNVLFTRFVSIFFRLIGRDYIAYIVPLVNQVLKEENSFEVKQILETIFATFFWTFFLLAGSNESTEQWTSRIQFEELGISRQMVYD